MSGHSANPIFFNKKKKFGRPKHWLTPPPTSDNISFLPYPPSRVEVICVSSPRIIAIGTVFCKIMCSSRSRCSTKKRVLINFTGKHLCWRLFSDKAAGWRPATLLKRGFSTGLFLCIFPNTFWCELIHILLLLVDIFFDAVAAGDAAI